MISPRTRRGDRLSQEQQNGGTDRRSPSPPARIIHLTVVLITATMAACSSVSVMEPASEEVVTDAEATDSSEEGGSSATSVTDATTDLNPEDLNPEDAASAVRVDGNRLVDDAGNTVRFRGINYAGSEYACIQEWGIFEGPADQAQIDAFKTWNVNTVRVILNEHCWLGRNGVPDEFGGEVYQQAVLDWIDLLRANGIWVIVSLIWSDAGDAPAHDQAVMANTDHSIDFWASLGAALANRDGIVIDLYGEPHDIDWDCWQSGCVTEEGYPAAGMQQLLDTVRDAGAYQPVLIGGLQYANDMTGWLGYPVVDSIEPAQLVAAWHVYDFTLCIDVECWDEELLPVAEQVPVVVAEFGESTCDGAFVTPLMEWMDSHQFSYLAWTWNPWGECATGPDLVTDWEGTPTGFGEAVRQHYLNAS